MVLRMKNFLGGSLKNPTFRGRGRGGVTKKQYNWGGLSKKGGLGQFADLRGVGEGVVKKEGVVF